MRSDPKSAPTLPAPDELTSGEMRFTRTLAAPTTPEAMRVPSSNRTPASDLAAEALVGTVIDGRYQVERIIGEGGMGIVYLGRHRVIDKRVAIKVLRREMARDQEMTERFMQEARTASSIGNAHIVDVSDFGILPEGATYFVMEYLDGRSLTSVLEELGHLSMPRVLHIAKQIARGLGAAHAAGIVHRDLKPDNVMLISRGHDLDFVKILDFGIAKVGSQATKLTRAGSIFGTPHYMSPEQAAGTPVDARTDVYALGVIMYEMTAGRVPFDAEIVMSVLSQHLYKAPTPLLVAAGRSDISASIEAVVMKCLAKAREDRYVSMDALIDDIEAIERGLMPLAMLDPAATGSSPQFEPPTGTSGVALAAENAQPSGWMSTRTAIVGTLAVAGVAAAIMLVVRPNHRSIEIAPAAPTAAAEPTTPPPLAPAPPAEKLLLLSVDPIDARVSRDGVDLGSSPIAIRLKEGERATVQVTRAGFGPKTEVFTESALEGTETRHIVRLEKLGGPASKASARPAPAKPAAPPSRARISEHDDPWKKSP